MLCECVPSPRAGPDALRLSVRCVPSSTDLAPSYRHAAMYNISIFMSVVTCVGNARKQKKRICCLWTWGTSTGTTHMCEFRDQSCTYNVTLVTT